MPSVSSILESQDNRSAKNRVLRAASKLFAAHGFRGTSVRQIASRARVNEVTVFRLFSSKRALYKEVLESKLNWKPPVWEPSEATLEDEKVFSGLADQLQQAFDPEFMRLLFFAALETPAAVKKSVSPKMDQFYGVVGNYLQKRMNLGAMRIADPQLVVKALVALIVYDRISIDLLKGRPIPADQAKTHTASLLEIWLHGVAR